MACTLLPHSETAYAGERFDQATGKITRFTFRNVDSAADHDGNLLDDIIFTKAYPLSYDGNGNTNGNAPQNK